MTPGQRRAVLTHAKSTAALSDRRACRFLGIHRSLVRYESVRPPEAELRARLRELAEQHWFLDLDDARRMVETWRIGYNTNRPHSGLGGRTPEEFAEAMKHAEETRLSA